MAEKLRQQEVLPVLEVRVLDTARKSSFRVRRLTEVPVVHTLDEMKKILQKYLPDINHVENCQFGYVLERNKKYSIASGVELENAYQHFGAGFQMWLDPAIEKRSSIRPRGQTPQTSGW